MREKIIEQKLVQAVKARGGIAPKFVSPSMDGMPDRLVLLPRGGIGFVEVQSARSTAYTSTAAAFAHLAEDGLSCLRSGRS